MYSHSQSTSQEVSHTRLPPEIYSLESTLVYAEDAASFLKDNENTIVPRLEEELLKLGYNGDYRLQAGFHEDVIYECKVAYPVVFLSLNGVISHDLQTASRALSPLFAPYSTLLITQAETQDLSTLVQSDVEEPDSYPNYVSIYPLSSTSPEHTSLPERGQNFRKGSIQGSSGQALFSMKNNNQHGDEDSQLEDELGDKGKRPIPREGDVEESSNKTMDHRRTLELELNTLLKRVDKDGNSLEPDILSNIQTDITIQLGDGQYGDYRPEGIPLPAHKDLREPWCFLNFSKLGIRGDATNSYSLAAVFVHMEATPMGTLCQEVFPDIPQSLGGWLKLRDEDQREWKVGGAVSTKELGVSAEVRGQHTSEIETDSRGWSHTTFHVKDSSTNSQDVDINYYASKVAPDLKNFSSIPGPHVVFSSEPNQRRTLRISIQALWTEKPTQLLTQPFRRDSDSFRNFLHRFLVEVDLDQMKKGNITAWSGNKRDAGEDIVKESWKASENLEQMRVVVLPQAAVTPVGSGETPRYRIEIPIQRSVIEAVKDGSVDCGFKEGKRKLVSSEVTA